MRFKTKTLLLASLVCLPVVAWGADLPVKAQPNSSTSSATAGYPAGFGWWWGLGAETDVANDSVASANAGANLYAAGAGVVGVLGYNFKIGSNWGAWEAGFTYQNLGGSTVLASGVAGSVTDPWDLETGVSFGFPWTQPFALFPSLSALFGGTSPVSLLPTTAAITSSLPYAGVYAHFDDVAATVAGATGSQWLVTPSLGLGLKNFIAGNGGVIDVRVEESFPNTGFTFGPGGPQSASEGYVTRLKAIYEY